MNLRLFVFNNFTQGSGGLTNCVMKSVLFCLLVQFCFAQDVWVNTSTGGYYRTAPNSTNLDNYSTRGNVNPYTGREGTIKPDSEPVKLWSEPVNAPATTLSYNTSDFNVARIVQDAHNVTDENNSSYSTFSRIKAESDDYERKKANERMINGTSSSAYVVSKDEYNTDKLLEKIKTGDIGYSFPQSADMHEPTEKPSLSYSTNTPPSYTIPDSKPIESGIGRYIVGTLGFLALLIFFIKGGRR